MSNRPSKKAGLAPGQVVGRSPESFFIASPQRKQGSKNGKRSAPQPKPLDASAPAFVPNASFHHGSDSSKSFKSFAAAARSNLDPAGSGKMGVRVDESKNTVVDADVNESDEDDDELWEDMVPSDVEGEEHIGDVNATSASSPTKSDDGSASNGGNNAAANPNTCSTAKANDSVASSGSSDYESDDEPPTYYADLSQFEGSIRYRYNQDKDFWFADYTKLSVKERRELLKSREQSSSGNKASLGRRLEAGDSRRLEMLRTCGQTDKLQQHERNIRALLASCSKEKSSRRCSQSSEPVGQSLYPGRSHSQPSFSRDGSAASTKKKSASVPEQVGNEHDPIDVEEGSDDDAAMDGGSKQSEAEDLFGNLSDLHNRQPSEKMEVEDSSAAGPMTPQASAADTNDKPPVKKPAAKEQPATPPETIATASTAQSTVSSLHTNASSLTGRLLNRRPCRDPSTDGVANFVSVSCPPAKDKATEPAKACHATIIKVFDILRSVDPRVVLYPIWDSEPGCDPIPPLSDSKAFPPDLSGLQVYCRVTNPWDLNKVKPGEIDKKTGELKRQKALYVVVLLGTHYSLDHVLEIAYPSLSSIGSRVMKKDVDALESVSLYAFVGMPNAWDSVSLTAKLQFELEKHEEWMMRNISSGYNAMQFADTEFPNLVVRRNQIRLIEGGDVLDDCESEVLQYAYSLRKPNTIEVSAGDKYRVNMALVDFKLRGKLKTFSADCDLHPLDVTSKDTHTVRLRWYRGIFAQMNYEHLHSILPFAGVSMSEYPARGEMDPCYHDGRRSFKHTCLRREVLDMRRLDGKKVFLGAIDGSAENAGMLMVYYYNDEANEQFIAGMHGNLPMFLFAYLKHVKGYSERSILAILNACTESYRLTARDAKWDNESRSITPVTQLVSKGFVDRMAQQDMHILLPEVMRTYSKSEVKSKKAYSDAAKEEVAKGYKFKDKPGYNPNPTDAASVLSENSHTTTGAASNRSVTTADIQSKLPTFREELNSLKEQLLEASPDDETFQHPLMSSTNIEELSLQSSASAQLAALYKDTTECIRLLKARLGALGRNGDPPPSSGRTGPSPSAEEGSRGPVQGE